MRILFLIKASGKKTGGHLFSMFHIAQEVSKNCDVKIISFGEEESVVINESPLYLSNCKVNSLKDILNLNKNLKEKLKSFKPDIIQSFDDTSYLLSTQLRVFKKSKLVFTKCGGKNPKNKFWIYADNLVVFSKENYDAFKSMKLYKNANLYLIPNRVNKIELKQENQTLEKKDSSFFNFVRIARIGENYSESIKSLFWLVYNLPVIERKYRIYVIGRVENENKFQELLSLSVDLNLDVQFITDSRTQIASQMLYLADCVLGTGRSLMEAMSLGIPVLTPLKNSKFPILVTRENFNLLLSTNFSERNVAPENIKKESFQKLFLSLKDTSLYKAISKETLNLFNEWLSIEKAMPLYDEVYKNALEKREHRMACLNWIYLIKTIKSI